MQHVPLSGPLPTYIYHILSCSGFTLQLYHLLALNLETGSLAYCVSDGKAGEGGRGRDSRRVEWESGRREMEEAKHRREGERERDWRRSKKHMKEKEEREEKD